MTAPDALAALRAAAQPILDRALDMFTEDDLDPESSLAMPVVLKSRWVADLRAALASEAEGQRETDRTVWNIDADGHRAVTAPDALAALREAATRVDRDFSVYGEMTQRYAPSEAGPIYEYARRVIADALASEAEGQRETDPGLVERVIR